jgi:DNA-binding SARP family transcriptional activator
MQSSVARVVTPAVARALELPDQFISRIERAGILVRAQGEDAFAYHPLLREFLLQRLGAESGEEEQRRLRGVVAPAIAQDGDPIEAIEHWLAAGSWPAAISAIEREGPGLARRSPGLMRRWLSLLPPEARDAPTILALEGQLEWGGGDHPRAAAALRRAVRGFRDHPNPPAEWLARFALADSIFATFEFDQLSEVVEGWDHPAAEGAGILAPATAAYVAVTLAMLGRIDESDRLAARALAHPAAALLGPVEAFRRSYRDTPSGHLDEVLAGMQGAVRELERSDPFNRRLYFLATLAMMYSERGYAEEGLKVWMRVREEGAGGAVPILVDSARVWCALLYATLGRLHEAETELALHEGQEQGWRNVLMRGLAGACVAALRGDVAETVASAERTLAVAVNGPVMFFHRTATQLVPPLVAVGRPDRAREVLDQTFALVDQVYPGSRGRFLRGRLLSLRAWLRYLGGDSDGGDGDLLRFWNESGETLPHTLRREWPRLQPLVWTALERGVLEPEVVQTLSTAFPEGLQLVAFLEHPVPAVRRAALDPATASGDPQALLQLATLARDPDRKLAGAAARATARLAITLPPLRFELLGRFGVRRGSWRAGDAWARPVDARLVRFLLVNLGRPVPEDVIFEALWPELAAAGARKSLQVAVSRARRVLDPPTADHSVIQSAERTYRLVLSERDVVDAEEFRSAARVALADTGDQRRQHLESSRALWGGEPLPEERYADWGAPYRELLIDLYTGVLAGLVELHAAAGAHTDAAEVARELVDLDSLNEGGHRALITAYARAGRTGYALRQYLECRRALVEQLGVEPSAATSRLQAQILAGEPV